MGRQGFDALEWKYEQDKQIAVSVNSVIMQRICKLTLRYQVDLLLGYIERSEDAIFSSCIFTISGKKDTDSFMWRYVGGCATV